MNWNKMVPELTVSNFSKSYDFYTRVLGFQVIHQRENPKFAYLDLDGAQIMLEEFLEHGWNTDELIKPYGRGVNFQIEVEDIEKVYKSVLDQNIKLFRPLKENWYKVSEEKEEGQKEFLIQDPDGFLLRFMQFLGERGTVK